MPSEETVADAEPSRALGPAARRARLVLRLIALERAAHSVIIGLFTAGLVLARHDHPGLVNWARELKDNTSRDASLDWFTDRVAEVIHLRGTFVSVLMLTAGFYTLVDGAAAVGLWRGRRWAEYVTALTAASFLPFDVRFAWRQFTVLRVLALVINLAVVVYLVWGRHLFGLRGGRDTLPDHTPAPVEPG